MYVEYIDIGTLVIKVGTYVDTRRVRSHIIKCVTITFIRIYMYMRHVYDNRHSIDIVSWINRQFSFFLYR